MKKACIGILFLVFLCACDSNRGDGSDSQATSDSSSESAETTTYCIFTPGDGNVINLGQYTGSPEQEEALSRVDYWLENCNGNNTVAPIDVSIDNSKPDNSIDDSYNWSGS